MAAIVIVRAEPQDCDSLSQIAQAAKRYWGYPERWLELWQAELTLSSEYIAAHQVYNALFGNVIAGFYSLVFDGQDAEIDHLWVEPAYIGQGIGRQLWEHASVQAMLQGVQRLVVLADPHAEGFYRKMGMTPAGERTFTLDGSLRVLPRLEYGLKR